MAYDLALHIGSGDLVLHDNDLLLIDDAERVAQQILITLRFWLGEWFLDSRDGVPYLEYILIKNPNKAHIRQILTEKISGVEGVEAVTDMKLAINNQSRELAVMYTARTAYGLLTRREMLGYGNG